MAKIIILSGAGLSAESGIPTFRDSDGLWENNSVFDVCNYDSLQVNLEKTLRFYNKRRKELKVTKPNKAHHMIVQLKNKYPDDICVITQNVDDLFEKAGCSELVHLHGFITNLKCFDKSCSYKMHIGYQEQDVSLRCPICESVLRPDVIFFGEEAPEYQRLYEELKECELFVVIGTSGQVLDINYLRRGIKYTILNNLESSRDIKTKKFTKVLYKPATEGIDEIASYIETFIETGKVEDEMT